MFTILAGIVLIAIFAILTLASLKPDVFMVTRSTRMNAAADTIYPHINDLRRWQAWSPYEKKDPNMQRTFSGPTSGKGAAYAWDGNKNVGAGSMVIIESLPPSKIGIRLDFLRPFAAQNAAQFLLEPEGSGTRVTWEMSGAATLVSKIMGTVMNMDKMIGTDFEVGLENLKKTVEG